MRFRERLWPSAWVYLSTALVIPASLLVFLPINPFVGVVCAIVLYAGCIALLSATAPVISVDETHLRAGKATIPLDLTGQATAYRGADATLERGRNLDARAWLVIRGWISPVVKIPVLDEGDPAPYWLVSTRKPDDLCTAIGTGRAA